MQLSLFPNKRGDDPYKITPERKAIFEKAKVVGFDIETSNDLGRIKDDFVRDFFRKGKLGISFLTDMVYLGLWCEGYPAGIVLDEDDINDTVTMDWVRKLFANPQVTFVAHNIVFDLRLISGRYNIPIPRKIWDTYSNEIIFGDGDPTPTFGGEGVVKQYNLLALIREYNVVEKADNTILHEAIEIAAEWDASLKQQQAITDALQGKLEAYKEAYFGVHRKLKSFRADITELPISVACAYTALDCMMTVLLMREQVKRMRDEQRSYPHIFQITDFENRFNRLCASMGATGIPINKTYLLELIKNWEKEMQAASRRMFHFCIEKIIKQTVKQHFKDDPDHTDILIDHLTTENLLDDLQQDHQYIWTAAAGCGDEYVKALKYLKTHGFSPTKPYDQQIYLFLACDIKLPERNVSNTFLWTDTGKPSTGKTAMQWYIERYGELLTDFIAYRANAKRIEKANELLIHSSLDGKVHSMIVTRTVTGRTSSSDPNLQNMRMREEWGTDEDGEEYLVDANFTGVLTSLPGYTLLGVDISNAETYMGAIMAKDNLQMQALYSDDYHSQMTRSYFPTLAAEAWQHKQEGNAAFWKGLRNASKAVTFGTAYGMGALKLARNPQLNEAVKPRPGQVEELQQELETLQWFVMQRILPETIIQYIPVGEVREYPNTWQASGQPEPMRREADEWRLEIEPANASQEDWEFAVKVWNAQKILKEKDRAFPATTVAKEMSEKFATRHGYVEMWSGRHVHIREPRKAWNAICQGGVAELTKRWAVLVHEFLESNGWMDAHIVNYVHDEIVIHCPTPFAEYISKTAIKLIGDVIETQPVDKSGVHWFDRTNPPGGFFCGIDHAENSHKWGKLIYDEYPFDTSLSWDATSSAELSELHERLESPLYRYEVFKNRRFYVPGLPGAGMGEPGLDLKQYVEHLEYKRRVGQDWQARELLESLETQACELQRLCGYPEEGITGAIDYGL